MWAALQTSGFQEGLFAMRFEGSYGTAAFQASLVLRPPWLAARNLSVSKCSLQNEKEETGEKKTEKRARRKPRPPARSGAASIADVSVGDEFIGTVCDVGPADSTWVEIGVATLTGKSVRARLRHRKHARSSAPEYEIGGIIPVYVHKLNRPAARIEVRKGLRPAENPHPSEDEVRMLKSVQLGEKFNGRVVGTGLYGAVVDINLFRWGKAGRVVPCTGLLPRKRFMQGWACEADLAIRDDVDNIIRVGDQIEVFARVVHVKNAFLLFDSTQRDILELEREQSERKRARRRKQRRSSPETLANGELRTGIVKEVVKYGLFVDIGVTTDGLVHYSEMGSRHTWDWKEVVKIGTGVTVEVLQVEGTRISLRLLFLEGEEEDLVAQTDAATARPEHVAHAGTVRTSAIDREENVSSPLQSTVENVTSQPAQDNREVHELARQEDSAEEEKLGEDGVTPEDQEDEVDLFSDEYFEDKYGY